MLRINAGAYSFEVANPRHMHEYRIWEDVELPDDKILIPGLIGHANNYVEHPELIAEYISRYADLVGSETRDRRCGLRVLVTRVVRARGASDRRVAQVHRPCPRRRNGLPAALEVATRSDLSAPM